MMGLIRGHAFLLVLLQLLKEEAYLCLHIGLELLKSLDGFFQCAILAQELVVSLLQLCKFDTEIASSSSSIVVGDHCVVSLGGLPVGQKSSALAHRVDLALAICSSRHRFEG